jgi:hypothetical protein
VVCSELPCFSNLLLLVPAVYVNFLWSLQKRTEQEDGGNDIMNRFIIHTHTHTHTHIYIYIYALYMIFLGWLNQVMCSEWDV